ncbi:MAG: 4Fe-4S binding protein [Bacteroidales bacterium]|nr:4Fe-4S binding protein [Bacteroidales bacterium]
MADYLEFRNAKCKDCYKCLRECPVKAIEVKNHQARIIESRCILCGRCTLICPQNAKIVHSSLSEVKQILDSGAKVIASVAPSFLSSFGLKDFNVFRIALAKLGFFDAEETAYGAELVTQKYKTLLESKQFKNFITSACPAVCRLIQTYYPKALQYLAPVDSPMIVHAKMIRQQHPDAKVIFIGPCIAKKREAIESGIIDGVLTFDDMQELFAEKNIVLDEIIDISFENKRATACLSKAYPISHGVLKSFPELPKGYDYMAVDGPDRCVDALQNIENLENVFLEMNICKDGCVNGPCSLSVNIKGGSIKATSDVLKYYKNDIRTLAPHQYEEHNIDLDKSYPRIRNNSIPPPEREIKCILAKIGKHKPEDELNCSACGYDTCRDKAWAVYNGYTDAEICLPYMRERAESLSYEIIQNSPNGIILLDSDFYIQDINDKGRELLGINDPHAEGRHAKDFFNLVDFMIAYNEKRNVMVEKMFVPSTGKYVDMAITYLKDQNMLFGILMDVSEQVNYDNEINKVKMETLKTTDEVIKKQMSVAQEIASLLGETTAETKVALLKLKKTLSDERPEKGTK